MCLVANALEYEMMHQCFVAIVKIKNDSRIILYTKHTPLQNRKEQPMKERSHM